MARGEDQRLLNPGAGVTGTDGGEEGGCSWALEEGTQLLPILNHIPVPHPQSMNRLGTFHHLRPTAPAAHAHTPALSKHNELLILVNQEKYVCTGRQRGDKNSYVHIWLFVLVQLPGNTKL